jgi:hypothetical protein
MKASIEIPHVYQGRSTCLMSIFTSEYIEPLEHQIIIANSGYWHLSIILVTKLFVQKSLLNKLESMDGEIKARG